MGKSAPTLQDPSTVESLRDWGPIADMLEGQSLTRGVLLHKGAQGENECGVWVCTPGHWRCQVTRDEFCHFLSGRATYTHAQGEVIEVGPDTIAFFPAGWEGTCRVHETVRKVYMIR